MNRINKAEYQWAYRTLGKYQPIELNTIFRTIHPTTEEFIFFQNVHEIFSRTEHLIDYTFKKSINIQGLNSFKGCSLTTVKTTK